MGEHVLDGNKLRAVLKGLRMTGVDLWRRMGNDGKPSYLYRLMDNRYEATYNTIRQISSALEISPIEILRDDVLGDLGLLCVGGVARGSATCPPWMVHEGGDGGGYGGAATPAAHAIPRPILVVGHVSAGPSDVPDYTDGDYFAGAGFDDLDLGDIILRDPHAYAVLVRGDSMLPLMRNGDHLIITPSIAWTLGDKCLVRHDDGRVWIKQVNRLEGDLLLLISLNPNPDYPPPKKTLLPP